MNRYTMPGKTAMTKLKAFAIMASLRSWTPSEHETVERIRFMESQSRDWEIFINKKYGWNEYTKWLDKGDKKND